MSESLAVITQQMRDGDPMSANCEHEILKCIKKTLRKYTGETSNIFLYCPKSGKVLNDYDYASRPEELQSCLEHLFDQSSLIVKKDIIDEISVAFGLKSHFADLKEVFECARTVL